MILTPPSKLHNLDFEFILDSELDWVRMSLYFILLENHIRGIQYSKDYIFYASRMIVYKVIVHLNQSNIVVVMVSFNQSKDNPL